MIALNTVVHNEAHRILGLLEHASAYCDELVVVDQDSDDGTARLARQFGAIVLFDVCRGSNEASRALCAEYTRADWIVSLDADETLTDDAILALPRIAECYHGATFARRNLIDGIRVGPQFEDGRFSPDHQFRFWKRGTVTFDDCVHGRIKSNFDKQHTFAGPEDPWIIHAKSQAEADLDHARYTELALHG